jgi:hypothetical protein
MLSWFQSPTAVSSFERRPPPVRSTLPGLPDVDPGDSFMRTVFNDMEVGDTQTAWSNDRSHLFVVRVTNRIPSAPADWDGSREQFLTTMPDAFRTAQFAMLVPDISPPPVLQVAERTRQQYFVGGVNLFEKYEIVLLAEDEQQP